jgi:hypothetical protein
MRAWSMAIAPLCPFCFCARLEEGLALLGFEGCCDHRTGKGVYDIHLGKVALCWSRRNSLKKKRTRLDSNEAVAIHGGAPSNQRGQKSMNACACDSSDLA